MNIPHQTGFVPPEESTNKWLVAGSIAIGAIMAMIDASIVNVALPHIRGSVGATIQEITWVSTAYMIAMVIVMPLTGFLGSFFGQKRIYMFCLALFILGSVLCGTSHTLVTLVIFRVLQGLGAGALQPSQQAILRQTFPLEEQGMAMAIYGMVIMVGPAVGPTLGGWITDNFSWQWIFYINLPIGIVGLMMVYEFVHEPKDIREANRVRAETQKKNLDWIGIVLISIGVSFLQYCLEEGQSKDWFQSQLISFSIVVAAVFLVAFVIRELTAPAPAVNLLLFKERMFMAGTLIGGVQFAMLMSNMFLLPIFMQEILGFTATQSGWTLMPRTLIMMVVTPFVGRIYNFVPVALLVAIGVVLFSIGAYWLSFVTLSTSIADILLPMIVTGVGFSFLFVPLTTAALSRIPRPQLSDAAGLNSFFRQIGGSLGLTISATLLTRFSTQSKAAIAQHVTLLRPETLSRLIIFKQHALSLGLDSAATQNVALQILNGKVAVQAAVLAFEKSFLLQGIAFLSILPLTYFLRAYRVKTNSQITLSME